MSLKWKNCEYDELPAHQMEVLISYRGVYHCATYDASENHFTTSVDDEQLVIAATEEMLYWTDYL